MDTFKAPRPQEIHWWPIQLCFFLKKTASRTLIKRMELILDISSSMSMLFCAFYSPVAGVLADRDILEFTLELHALYCTTLHNTTIHYTAPLCPVRHR